MRRFLTKRVIVARRRVNPLRRFVFVLAEFWVESLYEPTLSAPPNFSLFLIHPLVGCCIDLVLPRWLRRRQFEETSKAPSRPGNRKGATRFASRCISILAATGSIGSFCGIARNSIGVQYVVKKRRRAHGLENGEFARVCVGIAANDRLFGSHDEA